MILTENQLKILLLLLMLFRSLIGKLDIFLWASVHPYSYLTNMMKLANSNELLTF